jgi:putative ABC transport system substrate-binding protein
MTPSSLLRRRILFALCLAAALPGLPAGAADPPGKRRLGVLWPGTREDALKGTRWLLDFLERRGWKEGETLDIEWRLAGGSASQLEVLAAQFAKPGVDAIFTTGFPATKAAQKSAAAIPVVTLVADPVSSGFAKELAKPGGNITGLMPSPPEVARKQAELVKLLAPGAKGLAIVHAGSGASAEAARLLGAAAKEAGLSPESMQVPAAGAAGAITQLPKRSIEAAFVFDGAVTERTAPQVAKAAVRHRVALFGHNEQHVMDGFLASLAQHPLDNAVRHAAQLDRIFRGTSPSEIAFEGPKRFYFALNRQVAAELGLAVSRETVFKADQVVG